ncbi:hypothetical protein ACFOD0_09080 [Shewanella intestini]|nr:MULTISPECIES: hypothetical protein [Shewanella]
MVTIKMRHHWRIFCRWRSLIRHVGLVATAIAFVVAKKVINRS